MATTRNDSICSLNSTEETFFSSCSSDEVKGEWQELENYWGVEKCRLQDCDMMPSNMSNSLEKHLLYDDYINEPSMKEDSENSSFELVKGADINDIPTIYSTAGFRSHELIVIGTYIDRRIVPGFQYRVRKNLSDEYLFDGRALPLVSVGLGYGKRLTFRGDNLNRNKNFFWSDSHLHGFGLTFQALSPDTVFRIIDTNNNKDIGRVVINKPAISEDLEISTKVQDDGQIKKDVKVHFSGDVILNSNRHSVFYEDQEMEGKALVHRLDSASKANIKEIVLKNFIVENCLLVPED